MQRKLLSLVVAVAAITASPATVRSAEITVLGANALRAVMGELIPEFQRTTGHTVKVSFGTIGANTERVRKGDPADFAIVSPQQWDELQKEGKLAGNRDVLAKIGLGVVVKKGATKPDVSTVEAFKRTFLNARTVAVPVGTGGPASEYSMRLFERLGIAEEIRAKNVAANLGDQYPLAVSRGDAEVGFTQKSVAGTSEGLELAGPIPEELQNYTLYVTALPRNAKEAGATKAFVEFLMSPRATAALTARGLDRD